ncbi:MAG: hypothetical protein AABZ74_05040 [Cyanobacteriota bacterium]
MTITFVLLFLLAIYLISLIFSSVSIEDKLEKYPWPTETTYREKIGK